MHDCASVYIACSYEYMHLDRSFDPKEQLVPRHVVTCTAALSTFLMESLSNEQTFLLWILYSWSILYNSNTKAHSGGPEVLKILEMSGSRNEKTEGMHKFSKTYKPTQNSRCQMGDVKKVPYCGPKHTKRHRTNFSSPGTQAPWICAHLIQETYNFVNYAF